MNSATDSYETSPTAKAARRDWEDVVRRARLANRPLAEQLALELRDTEGGRNLLGIGMDRDLIDSAQIDRFRILPELQLPSLRITAAV